jgi:beta-xylosidase
MEPVEMSAPRPTTAAMQPATNYPWISDRGDGTYANPILCADYSDPDAIRVGDDFYLTASSFTDTPGLPILHSRDLVNWTIINHAIRNVPGQQYDTFQPGCGVWAPSIRYHANQFWIFFPTPDEGIYLITAGDPAGQWSEPKLIAAGKGLIDPCPLWDDDGKAYLVHAWARSRSGIKHRLTVREMSPDGSKLIGEGKTVFEDPQRHPTMEGPKFLKRNRWYYILAPAGGVPTGWQVALRSKNILGPYEDKIVLERGASPINGPHQGALLDTPSGEWWFIHFQELQPYGRIAHLQPVNWKDDWPLMGIDTDGNGVGEPVLIHRKPKIENPPHIAVPQTSDEFDSKTLGLQWQWHANHRDDWHSLTARPGSLRLIARPIEKGDLQAAANLLLQKLPARSFTVETRIDAASLADHSLAGLITVGKKHAALAIERAAGAYRLILRIDNETKTSAVLLASVARVRLCMRDGGVCTFAFAGDNGPFQSIGPSFQAVEGQWIGAKVGLLCVTTDAKPVESFADFEYFRFGKV